MAIIILLVSGCELPSNADMLGTAGQKGFLHGLWMGFIAPLKFIVAFFVDDLSLYAMHNNGQWYDFGFLLGIGGFSGGIFKSARRRR